MHKSLNMFNAIAFFCMFILKKYGGNIIILYVAHHHEAIKTTKALK